MAPITITDVRFEHAAGGIDPLPKNWKQTSYDVEIARSGKQPQSFHVESSSSVLVPWPDSPLASAETAIIRVKSSGTSDNGQLNTEWSEPATVEAALLSRDDWSAKPITAPELNGGRARFYITALGIYEAYLNGKRIGDEWLAPGWTAYQHRIQYQVFDVGPLLKPGQPNILSVEVSEGWYAGRVLWGDGLTCFYGDRIGVLAQLDLLDSGSEFRLTTDESWECHPSPIVGSDIYDGETYDLGLEVDDWHHDTSKWTSVETLPFPKPSLVPSSSPPVRITETIKPIKVFADHSGKALIDFGQNLVGKLVLHSLKKPDGHRLTIRHAEVLENGYLGIRPLRRAKQTDTIIFGGGRGLQHWSPHFTYHGFRYAGRLGCR
ncbi:alfa-L-rhamnosidase [Colletotrichum asianum]